MNRGIKVKRNLDIILVVYIIMQVVNGYPIARTEKSIESEEKHFPNDTIIGKYAYLDKEGNPVQVKYYADDSSYGVELNSFRIAHENREVSASPTAEKQAKKLDKASPNIPAKEKLPEALAKGGSFDFIDTFKYPESTTNNKHQAKPDYPTFPHKEGSTLHQKSKYKSPDYEVYAKNDVDSPPQCGTNNEKVRVYNFVKEGRKAREVPEEDEQPEEGQFCEL